MRAEFYSNSHEASLNQAVADFVSGKIWGKPGCFEHFATMAVFSDDAFVGGVVYHNYDPAHGICELSAGANTPRWVTRHIVQQMISMPFYRLGCQSVIARHSANRDDLRRIWRSFGAVEHIIPRLRGKDAPPECLSLLTQEAWMESKFMAKNKVYA